MNLINLKTHGSIDPVLFILFIVLPLFTATLCLFYAFRFLKRARTLEDIPMSKIRSAAQGYVALTGKISSLSENAVYGALSKKPCVWYRYVIQVYNVYRTENGTESRWETLQQGASQENFLLNDDTGTCIINPSGAAIITASTLRWYGNTPTPPPYPEPSFWNLFFGTSGRFCYLEERLEENTEVYVTGMFNSLSRSEHILNNEGLGQKQSLLVSAVPQKKVARDYRFKAFIFFLSFLFFVIMVVSSSYRIVINSFTSLP